MVKPKFCYYVCSITKWLFKFTTSTRGCIINVLLTLPNTFWKARISNASVLQGTYLTFWGPPIVWGRHLCPNIYTLEHWGNLGGPVRLWGWMTAEGSYLPGEGCCCCCEDTEGRNTQFRCLRDRRSRTCTGEAEGWKLALVEEEVKRSERWVLAMGGQMRTAREVFLHAGEAEHTLWCALSVSCCSGGSSEGHVGL